MKSIRLLFFTLLACVPVWGQETSAPIPFSQLGAKATADYRGDALAVEATPDGARLRTGFQKLAGTVSRTGLVLDSTAAGAGSLRLSASALGRAGAMTALPATGEVRVQGQGVAWVRPGVTEEYSVSVDGLRQDFVVQTAPAQAGALLVELALEGARAEAAADGAKLTLAGSGRALAYAKLHVTDATGRDLPAHMEVAAEDRLRVVVEDAGAAYPVRIDPTFSDANWVSLNPGMPGAGSTVSAVAADGFGNVYIGGSFAFVGSVSTLFVAKWNGTSWSALGSGMNNTVTALAVDPFGNLYAGGTFTTAGGVSALRIAKWNGSAWSALGSGFSGGTVSALAFDQNGFLYAGGTFTTAGVTSVLRIARWDGLTWSALGSGFSSGAVNALAVDASGSLYAGGSFIAAGTTTVNRVAKWNGTSWSALGSGLNNFVAALAVDASGSLYAGGSFTAAGTTTVNRVAKWDGTSWSALGSGLNNVVAALAVDPFGNLYAGGSFNFAGGVLANFIAKWNGSVWSALGTGMNNPVTALAVDPLGNLCAGGTFTSAGGLAVDRIARWHVFAQTWSAFGSGMNNNVRALVVDPLGNLYVGGDFLSTGTVPASYIARWDGSAWSPLGAGMDNFVAALAVDASGNLYAGGTFTTAGGVSANGIAKWNGFVWSALGAGTGGTVNALAVDASGNLYAGGSFTTAGGSPANRIAKWDGVAWSALGAGTSGTVLALAVGASGNLYAGGTFTSPANNVAKWDGSAWSALGAGTGGTVNGLAVDASGALYAGGTFSTAGVALANNVAKWNGSAWSALGSGTATTVNALAFDASGNLYVGGAFVTAGGASASRVAKWDGSAWSALGSGANSTVNALVLDSAGHAFIGGIFTTAGGKVSPFIAQANFFSAPTVSAPTSSNVSTTSTALGGNVTSDGGATVTGRGVVVALTATNSNPVIGGTGVTTLTASGTTGIFSVTASGLTPGASYSYAAYATNIGGTSYTSVGTFLAGGPQTVGIATGAGQYITPEMTSPYSPNQIYVYPTSGLTPIKWNITPYLGRTASGNATLKLSVWQNQVAATVSVYQLNAYNADLDITTPAAPANAVADFSGSYRDQSESLRWRDNTGAAIDRNLIQDDVANITTGGVLGTVSIPDNSDGALVTVTIPQATVQAWLDGTLPPILVLTTTSYERFDYSLPQFANAADGNRPLPTMELSMQLPAEVAVVTTPTSASVTASTATLGGNVTADGGAAITERGVVFSKTSDNADPQIGGANVTKVTASGTTGVFTVSATGLETGTSYSFKAYATNSVGTSYTSVGTFTTALSQGNLTWNYTGAANVPAMGLGVTLTGGTATLALGFAPVPGTELMVLKNTGIGFISGTFSNLAHGQTVTLTYDGATYEFVANYYGGTGNDLVLVWKANRLAAWGYNNVGELGDGTTTNRSVPVSVTPGALAGKTVVSIARGSAHSVALCADGTVVTWGQGLYGQLGNGAFGDSSVPVPVKTTGALAGKTVVAVTAGEAGSAALCSDGTVVTWGFNSVGQLGDGTTTNRNEPVLVGGLLASKSVVALQQGSRHCLVLCSDGTLITWGQGTINQLGNGSATDSSVPVAVIMSGVLAGKTVVGITACGYHNFVTCSDGTIAAWGRNADGRVGDGTTTDRNEPVLLSLTGALAGKTITSLSGGASQSFALCSDGTVAAWGHGTEGQLGNGSTGDFITPVSVVTSGALAGKTVVAVGPGQNHTVALCSDGTVVGWGYNPVGQVGDGTTTNRLSPVTVDSGVLASGERFSKLADGPLTDHSLTVVAYVPTAPTVSTPTSASVTASTATLGGNVTSDNGSTVTERGVVYSLTSANADPLIGGTDVTKVTASGTTGVFTAPVTGLAEVSGYSFKAYATSAAGTSYTSVAIFTTLDGTPPDTTITSTQATPTNSPSATITFTGTDNVGVTSFEGRLDGAAFATVTSPVVLSGLADGSHTYEVRALDAAGNVDATPATVTWTVDTVAPSLTLPANITTEATSAAGAAVTYTASANDVGGSGVATSSFTPASGSTFAIGTTTVNASATDNAGNTATSSFTVTVVAPVPTVASITPASGTTAGGTSVTITGTGFTGATAVTIGGAGTVFNVTSWTTITAQTAAHAAGVVDVAVTTPGGTGTGTGLFTYATPADYAVTISGGALTVTDTVGNADTLALSEPSSGTILFAATGRTFSVNGAALTSGDSGSVSLAGITSITVNAAGGADTINVGVFANTMPSLTLNGGTGDDVVNFNGDITFASGASLDVDLQNDDATPGTDAVIVASNANLITTGTGTIVVKVSKNVLLNSGSSFETENGGITVEANQQTVATSGTFNGVLLSAGLIKSTGTGAVTVMGRGGDLASGGQHGVQVDLNGGIVGGSGAVTVVGTGGAPTGASNLGVYVFRTGSRITSTSGNVLVRGFGGGSGTSPSNRGVQVSTSATVSAGGSGTVTVEGTGGTSSGNTNYGVMVDTSATITSGGGGVQVTGFGGGSGASATSHGVHVTTGGQVTAGGSGTVTVQGTGAASSGAGNVGVNVNGTNALVTSGGGNVNVTGLGGGSGASGGNVGISVTTSSSITAGGTGTVTLNGTGSSATTGANNYGVSVSSAQVTSSGGNVSVTGTGGASSGGGNNNGISIGTSGSITAGGAGTVTVNGTGGAGTGNFNIGVFLSGTSAQVTSSGGNVSVTGTGVGTGASIFNYGVNLNSAAKITAGGAGTVTVNGTGGVGTGGNNQGVILQSPGTLITSSGGDVLITGTAGAVSGVGISLSTSDGVTTATNGGNVILVADRMGLGNPVSTQSTGTVTLRQKTNAVAINLGSTADTTASTLELSNTELNSVTAGTVVIGDANSGAISISAVLSPATYQTLDIQKGVSFTSAGGFTADVSSATVYEKIKANGAVSISTSATLTVAATGGFVPLAGDTFTILNNVSASATTGNFSGKPQNTPVSIGGVSKGVVYNGGTGNDVVLVTPTPEIAVEQPAGTNLVAGTASIGFGDQNLGVDQVKTFTIKNSGSLALTVSSVSVGGANAGDFTLSTAGPLSVPVVTGSTTFTVTFRPSALGARAATLSIASDDADESPFTIALTGAGIDTIAPVIAAHGNVGPVEATGPGGATVSYTTSATDNSGAATVSSAPASGSTFPIGTTPVTINAVDASANAATPVSFDVIVQDTTGPAITVPANITTVATSQTGATVSFTAPTATDLVDGAVTATPDHASGSFFPIGTTTVQVTAADSRSNSSSGSFTVTVTANALPVVAVDGGGGGSVGFDNHFTGNSGTLPAGWATQIQDPSPGTGFVESGTTVTITDGRSNGPTLMVGPSFGAVSALTATVVVDSTSGVAGTEPTTITALGGLVGKVLLVQFNTVTKRFSASVLSNGASVRYDYTLAAGQHLPAYAGGAFSYAIVAGTNGFHITSGSYDSGELLYATAGVAGFTTLDQLGTTNAVLLGTECGGSTANGTLCSIAYDRLVVAGTGVGGGSTTVTAAEGSAATQTGTFSDAEGNATVTLTASSGTITQDNMAGTWSWSATGADGPATSTVTITATDVASGEATATFDFTVTNVAPTVAISAPAAAEVGTSVSFTFTATDVSSADQAAPFAWEIDYGDGSGESVVAGLSPRSRTHTYSSTATYTVTVTATDKDGGVSAVGSHTLVIRDTTPPEMSGVPANITTTATSNAGAVVTFTAPTALDAVDGPVTVNCVPASGSTFAVGTTTVICTATDAANNSSSASFTVTVGQASQTITFNPPATAVTTDAITLSATGGGSGNAVTFSVFSGPGSIGAGNVLTFTGAGSVVVTANQAGNASYLAAAEVSRTIEVTVANTSLTLVNDGAFAGSASILIDVLGNDTTASGTLALVSVTPPVSGGTAMVEGARVRFTRVGAAGAPVTFTYTASNGSTSATATVTVKSVSGSAGSYIGLLRRADGKVRGRVTATVTSTGLVTGTVRREGTSFSYKGSLLGAMSGATSAVMLPSPLRLAPGADGPTGQPTLAVSLPDTAGVQMLRGNAERAPYSATNPAPQAGRYTIVANRPTGGSGPAVGAALTCVVTSQGVVTIGGKLGNGVMAAQSGRLLDGGRYPFYVSSGGGALMQNMAGEPVFNRSLVPAVSGALRWTVPNGADARLSGGLAQDYDAHGLIYTPGFNAAAMFSPSTPSALLTLPIPSFRAAPIVTSLNLTGTPYKGVQTVYFPPGVGKVLLSPGNGFFSGTRYASKYEYRTFFGVVQQGSVNAGKGIVLDVTSLQQLTLAP